MRELAKDAAAIDVTDLLTRYSFDLGGYAIERVVESWLNQYPVQWVRLAVIEALYQGRYKAFSVEQILNLWQRRGRSLYRFTHEFERIICGRFPNNPFIHHEAVQAAASRSQAKPASVSPPISPIQPIVKPPEPVDPLPAVETVVQADLPEEEPGIAIWSPVDTMPELSRVEEFEATRPVHADPVEADFGDADLTSADFADGEQQAEPVDDSEDETVSAIDPPAEESGLDLSDADLDSTRPIPRGGPVPTFRPATSADLELFRDEHWSNSITHQQPIHQFIPTPEPSDFYSKLRAVALQSAPAHRVDVSHLASTEADLR